MSLYNLVRCYTDTTGPDDISVGAAVLGYLDFSGVLNGATVSYGLHEGNQSEVGRGVWNSITQTLTRVPLASTNGGGKIDLLGHAQVYITALAEDFSLPGPVNHPYGSMYADDILQVVVVAAPNVYYPVPGSLAAALCSPDFTFQNSKELLCHKDGVYLITWGMSIVSTNGNEDLSGAAMMNNTELHQSEGSAEVQNSSRPVHVGGSCVVFVGAGDIIRLAVENEDAAHNITVQHANLTIVEVA